MSVALAGHAAPDPSHGKTGLTGPRLVVGLPDERLIRALDDFLIDFSPVQPGTLPVPDRISRTRAGLLTATTTSSPVQEVRPDSCLHHHWPHSLQAPGVVIVSAVGSLSACTAQGCEPGPSPRTAVPSLPPAAHNPVRVQSNRTKFSRRNRKCSSSLRGLRLVRFTHPSTPAAA